MPDSLTPSQRHYAMSQVKSKDTMPERRVRSELHRRGLRFRKHVRTLPGTPDIVFTRLKLAVFIDGDFWHGYHFHTWEYKLSPYWRTKVVANRRRDAKNIVALRRANWRVARVWTHSVKHDLPGVIARIEQMLASQECRMQSSKLESE